MDSNASFYKISWSDNLHCTAEILFHISTSQKIFICKGTQLLFWLENIFRVIFPKFISNLNYCKNPYEIPTLVALFGIFRCSIEQKISNSFFVGMQYEISECFTLLDRGKKEVLEEGN